MVIISGTFKVRGDSWIRELDNPPGKVHEVEIIVDGKRIQVGGVCLGPATISHTPPLTGDNYFDGFPDFEYDVDFTVVHRATEPKEKVYHPYNHDGSAKLCKGGGARVHGHSIVKKKVGPKGEVVSYHRCPVCDQHARVRYRGLEDKHATLQTPAWIILEHYEPEA